MTADAPQRIDPPACYVCGAAETRLHGVVNGFPIRDCPTCALRWVAGDLSGLDLAAFYNDGYYRSDGSLGAMGYRDYAADEQNHRQNARRIIRCVARRARIEGAKALYVGCGFGFLLDELRRGHGCRCTGLELSPCAAEYVREKLGLDVRKAPTPAGLAPDSFDLAFLIGTIEHLTDPRAMLRDIGTVLKPGGLLTITTLDIRGPLRLYALKPPEHLFYFSRGNLRRLLAQTGFRTVSCVPRLACYSLHDLLHRLAEFFSVPLLGRLGRLAAKWTPGLNLLIPTNEMLLVAEKAGS